MRLSLTFLHDLLFLYAKPITDDRMLAIRKDRLIKGRVL